MWWGSVNSHKLKRDDYFRLYGHLYESVYNYFLKKEDFIFRIKEKSKCFF